MSTSETQLATAMGDIQRRIDALKRERLDRAATAIYVGLRWSSTDRPADMVRQSKVAVDRAVLLLIEIDRYLGQC
jgi:hypothetical protein